jgi:hypothetical protein
MIAGAQALRSAQLGGKDFFGYFLGHKKVTFVVFQPNPHNKFLYILDPDGVKIQLVETIK